jgi:hypothetical protein
LLASLHWLEKQKKIHAFTHLFYKSERFQYRLLRGAKGNNLFLLLQHQLRTIGCKGERNED